MCRKGRRVGRIVAVCVLVGSTLFTSAHAQSAGGAVVVDVEYVAESGLPTINRITASPQGVAKARRAYRAAGMKTAVDPSGRCLAVTRSPHVTEARLRAEDASNYMLAAGIVERLTIRQLSSRRKGFLRPELLSKAQWEAVCRIAHRYGFTNEQGQSVEPGSHLRLGIWTTWVVHLGVHKRGQTICFRTKSGFRPPTTHVVSAPPLRGSVLWYSWPHSAATWGNEEVSVEAGTYTLSDLSAKLSAGGKHQIAVEQAASGRRVAVVAEGIPLRRLLWAIEVATGLRTTATQDSGRLSILMASDGLLRPRADSSLLRAVPGFGYYLLPDSKATRKLRSDLSGGSAAQDGDWIGWSLSDLPLLYQNLIKEEWPPAYKSWIRQECGSVFESLSREVPPLHPDSVWVLWTKAVLVSVELQQQSGGGGGVELPLLRL